VCIYISKNICFNVINLDQYIKEKDFEICALKICETLSCFTVICIYRSPTGDFNYFLNQLESILNITYKTSTHIILCGDININYLDDNSTKHILDSPLASFGLFSTVEFPTRISYQSCTQIDNVFINIYNHDFSVHPLINGLSDHDGQIKTFLNIANSVPRHISTITRKINRHSIKNFTLLLSYENWEDVFLEKDVDTLFNNFLNTHLRIFYASFPNIKTKNAYNPKLWLTTGIRISCANKRKLYLTYRKINNPTQIQYYKSYCQILSKVIMLTKKLHYNNLISKSNNKPKTTWNIVRTITSNRNTNNNITTMNVKNKFSSNSLKIANAFNSHFLLVAENLHKNFYGKNTNNHINPLSYLQQNFGHFSTLMKVKNTTTHEIDRIIHSIKSKDSSGYNEIFSRILKISAPYVLSSLTFIFNKILDTGVFPERLKFSEVNPYTERRCY